MGRAGLRLRITAWAMGYTVLLSLLVVLHGNLVNERAEKLVWKSLLVSELDHYVARRRADAAYRWEDSDTVSLYTPGDGRVVPPKLESLAPGIHDDVHVDDRERVVLVRDVDGQHLVLSLDITELERHERKLTLQALAFAVLLVLLLGVLVAWGVGRLVRPLAAMARHIGGLQPDHGEQRLVVDRKASAELVVIADAFNDYLERNARFVARERAFIDSTSHELRTPIAVIAGATELALAQPDLPAPAAKQMARVSRTAREVEELISLLLVLAKDPARLAAVSERVSLTQLVPEIVEDHRYLTRDKDLRITVAPLPASEITAPLMIVQAAIGNLLRNAIENSDRGEIRISLLPEATVVIADPGHGMSPEEISAIYARLARGGGREGGGIGLDLISRLCEHLGWELDIASDPGRGTTTTLRMQMRRRDVSA